MLLKMQRFMRQSLPPSAYRKSLRLYFNILAENNTDQGLELLVITKAADAWESWPHKWYFLPFAIRVQACYTAAGALRQSSFLGLQSHLKPWLNPPLGSDKSWLESSGAPDPPQFLITVCFPLVSSLKALCRSPHHIQGCCQNGPEKMLPPPCPTHFTGMS